MSGRSIPRALGRTLRRTLRRTVGRVRARLGRAFRFRGSIPRRGQKLHVGCGPERLEGWINIDLQDLPSVDVVADVTRGLAFEESRAVYAEHFLEHLPLAAAVEFLRESHRVLADGGLIRLSTPNLDWVVLTHYHPLAGSDEIKVDEALRVNRAFHGWGHHFLWNREILAMVLEAVGFVELEWPRRGESRHPELAALERHEPFPDTDDLPHLLVVEAVKGPERPEALAALRERLDEGFLRHLDGRHV